MRALDESGAALALKSRILAAAAAAPSRTRGQGRRLTSLVVALSLAAGLTLFELTGGVAHARDRPLVVTVRLADGWALASAVLTWLTVRFSAPLVREAEWMAVACAAAPAVLLAWVRSFHGDYVDPAAGAGWACFASAIAMAVTPLVGLLWARRGSEPRHPATLGAALGCSCGAWAGVLGLLRCPHTDALHAMTGHVAPLVAITLAGALAGSRVLVMRGSGR